jgi:hypothetical protein
LLIMLAARPVQAQTEAPYDPGFAREGVYVGIGGSPSLTFKADQFAGDYGYIADGDGEIFVIPSVNKRAVPRVVVGLRSRPLAIEFSYDRARFTGDYLGVPLVSVYNAINVDAKFFFRTRTKVQPHVAIGMGLPWVNIENGSYPPGSDPTLDPPHADATLRGPGLNTEVGLTAFATPRVGISIGYAFRTIKFNRARGIDEQRELHPPFWELRGTPVVFGFVTF